jgi:hypothetical protein
MRDFVAALARNGCLASLLLLSAVAGCGDSTSKENPAQQASQAADNPSQEAAPPVPHPSEQEIPESGWSSLRVTTTEPGYFVFLDDVPARFEDGEYAKTPCEVRVPKGVWSVALSKQGRGDVEREWSLAEDVDWRVEADPDPQSHVAAAVYARVTQPLFRLPVGTGELLRTLNSSSREADPCVTPDGLTMWYVSNRPEGQGVYSAARSSVYHHFGTPTLLTLSRGEEEVASPCQSADGLTVAYAEAARGRAWSVTRDSPLGPFENRQPLNFDPDQRERWPSLQLSPDGLRLYWLRERDGQTVTRAAVRKDSTGRFGQPLDYPLPGGHPCLSADGLRHYWVEGSRIMRARRGSLRDGFGEAEELASLPSEELSLDPARRSWWISEDERWLYVASAGDLSVFRLAEDPGWRTALMAKIWDGKEKPKPVDPFEIDPKMSFFTSPSAESSAPTMEVPPYAEYSAKLRDLLKGRDLSAAEMLANEAADRPELKDMQDLIAWDRELVADCRHLVALAEVRCAGLEPGSPVRVGRSQLAFEKLEDGKLFLKSPTGTVEKSLQELDSDDLIRLAITDTKSMTDDDARAVVAWLLSCGGTPAVTDLWKRLASEPYEEFQQRTAGRLVRLAEIEIAAGKFDLAVPRLAEALSLVPEGPWADRAHEARNSLFESPEWKPVGARDWAMNEPGLFAADVSRAENSYIASTKTYGSFELRMDWRVLGKTGQGGVYFHEPNARRPARGAKKVHLANDGEVDDLDVYSTGSLFGETAPTKKVRPRTGELEWNTFVLRVDKGRVSAWINGELVLETTTGNSPDTTGRVLLDGVAGGIVYRNVLLYEVFPTTDSSAQPAR